MRLTIYIRTPAFKLINNSYKIPSIPSYATDNNRQLLIITTYTCAPVIGSRFLTTLPLLRAGRLFPFFSEMATTRSIFSWLQNSANQIITFWVIDNNNKFSKNLFALLMVISAMDYNKEFTNSPSFCSWLCLTPRELDAR